MRWCLMGTYVQPSKPPKATLSRRAQKQGNDWKSDRHHPKAMPGARRASEQVATFELELMRCTSHTTLVLQSCGFREKAIGPLQRLRVLYAIYQRRPK